MTEKAREVSGISFIRGTDFVHELGSNQLPKSQVSTAITLGEKLSVYEWGSPNIQSTVDHRK